VQRGIEVNDDTLALDLIRKVNFSGNYLAQPHTARFFRQEHYLPTLMSREPYDGWLKAGGKSALERAKERARKILAEHEPRQIDPAIEQEMSRFRKTVAARTIEDFYAGELPENQDYGEPQGYPG